MASKQQQNPSTEDLHRLLETGARELGIDLDDREVSLFFTYLNELTEWNRKINLSAIRDEKGIVIRHFLDSLALHGFLNDAASLLDIGSGAGFPGIPLKIVEPSLEVVLLDGVGKKTSFMRHVIRLLSLHGITAVHGRAEDPALVAHYTGGFDLVVSRAFARLNDFLMIAFPYAKEGGRIIAVKGAKGKDELEEANSIPSELRLERTEKVAIPFSDMVSHYFIFRKTAQKA